MSEYWAPEEIINLLKQASRFLEHPEWHPPEKVEQVCEVIEKLHDNARQRRKASPWRNFRKEQPSDGESYEFLWVEHYGTKRREIGTFSGVDGWIWVGGNGINPREKKAVFYRKLAAPPTPAEIEAAMKGDANAG